MVAAGSSPALVALVACLAGAGVGALVALAVVRGHPGRSSGGGEAVLSASIDEVRRDVRSEMNRLSSLVHQLGQMSAERFGQVDRSLQEHARAASVLSDTTRSLRNALANPQARGQWGERMADDVLRLAGMVENVNYVRQVRISGRGEAQAAVPDYTFLLPHGQQLHMDVKFPFAAYLRMQDATSEVEREVHLRAFLGDVRARVRELAARDYRHGGDQPSLDFVVMFLPNEHLAGFIHEHDPDLIDVALRHRVVLCSPLTLYAFLGVVRQACDAFVVEQTSDQILALIGSFDVQWGKFSESLDGVKRRVDSLQRDLDVVLGTRRRALERPLREIDALRRQRGVTVPDVPDVPDDLAASSW